MDSSQDDHKYSTTVIPKISLLDLTLMLAAGESPKLSGADKVLFTTDISAENNVPSERGMTLIVQGCEDPTKPLKVFISRPIFELGKSKYKSRYFRLCCPTSKNINVLYQRVLEDSLVSGKDSMQTGMKPLMIRSVKSDPKLGTMPLIDHLESWFTTTANILSQEAIDLYAVPGETGYTIWLEDCLALIDLCHLLDITIKSDLGDRNAESSAKSIIKYYGLKECIGEVEVNLPTSFFHGAILRYCNAFRARSNDLSESPKGNWMYFKAKPEAGRIFACVEVFQKSAVGVSLIPHRFDRNPLYTKRMSPLVETIKNLEDLGSSERADISYQCEAFTKSTPEILRVTSVTANDNCHTKKREYKMMRSQLYCLDFEYLIMKEDTAQRGTIVDGRRLCHSSEWSRVYEDSASMGHYIHAADARYIRFSFRETGTDSAESQVVQSEGDSLEKLIQQMKEGISDAEEQDDKKLVPQFKALEVSEYTRVNPSNFFK